MCSRRQEAISHALDAFPGLHTYDPKHVTLSVRAGGENYDLRQRVRVPRLAWPELVRDLRKYELVHVSVDDDRPPSYRPLRRGVVTWMKDVVKWRRGVGTRRLALGPPEVRRG